MSRIVTLRIGYEQKLNPDLPSDLWTQRGITCGKGSKPVEPATFLWLDWVTIIEPERAEIVLELLQGLKSLDHALEKWELEQ